MATFPPMICAHGGGEELFVCFCAHTPVTGARKSYSTGSKLKNRAREETVTLLFLVCPADSTGTQCGRAETRSHVGIRAALNK